MVGSSTESLRYAKKKCHYVIETQPQIVHPMDEFVPKDATNKTLLFKDVSNHLSERARLEMVSFFFHFSSIWPKPWRRILGRFLLDLDMFCSLNLHLGCLHTCRC